MDVTPPVLVTTVNRSCVVEPSDNAELRELDIETPRVYEVNNNRTHNPNSEQATGSMRLMKTSSLTQRTN
ncbi:hypothetical protein J6590_028219 [Homalodisca vitripennis]|nr:hypothetical protein J6590_098561 [Homalodisca vitripennis]KAG8322152.1 hypothetical protein J6590_028219 [Homalodisca vitripennis]